MAVDDEVTGTEEQVIPAEQVESGESQVESESGEGQEEEVYTFADSPPQEEEEVKDNHVLSDLRKAHREAVKRAKQAEARARELEAAQAPVEQKPKLEPKPTLESCDYDPEVYESKLSEWFETKKKVEAEEASERAKHEEKQREWEAKRKSYDEAKKRFPLDDFEDAEFQVRETLNEVQQGILLHVAEKPERLVYALGKSPAKAKELASIQDPLKLAVAIHKFEGSLVSNKKTAPPPERTVRSGGGASPGESARSYDEAIQRIMERGGNIDELRRFRQQNRK